MSLFVISPMALVGKSKEVSYVERGEVISERKKTAELPKRYEEI